MTKSFISESKAYGDEIVIGLTPAPNHFPRIPRLVRSVVDHTSLPCRFCFLVENPELLPRLPSGLQTEVKELQPSDRELLESWYLVEQRDDIPCLVYSKLLLPEYFPHHEKILYLEVDEIVQGDLGELWQQFPLGSFSLAAARSRDKKRSLTAPETFCRAFPDGEYFNSGVLLINTLWWNSNDAKAICDRESRKQKEADGHYYDFYDQGILNHGFQTHLKEFSFKFNTTGLGHLSNLSESELNRARVLHWNGPRKPWQPEGLYRKYYYYNLSSMQLYALRFFERALKRFGKS
jgi:lipopolysaccharide biosynthesis glycosyltransferase